MIEKVSKELTVEGYAVLRDFRTYALTLFSEIENNNDIALSVANFVKACLLKIGDQIEKTGPFLKAKLLEVNGLVANATAKRGIQGVDLMSLLGGPN